MQNRKVVYGEQVVINGSTFVLIGKI